MSLKDIIVKIIKDSGPISFKKYMDLALYHDNYGYYRKSEFPVGKDADFITSPHTSRLFGAIIANQLIEFNCILSAVTDKPFTIVEMGAGSGFMAKDILVYLRDQPPGIKDYNYVIIEPSIDTRKIQKENLEKFSDIVTWVNEIKELEKFSGCFVSNELIDAFPVDIVCRYPDGYRQMHVGLDNSENFKEIFLPVSDKCVQEYCKCLPDDLSVNYRTEINLEIKNWLYALISRIDYGFVLTIDYGYTWHEYFMPHRNRGTILGYYAHNAVDNILQYPGLIDITSHVNFSDMHRWGLESGFDTVGYTHQYAFMGGLDFEKTFKKIYGKVDPFSPAMAAVKMLIMPQGMGESHKVMVQSAGIDNIDIKLSGFSFANHMKGL